MPQRSPLKVQGNSTQRGASAHRRRRGQTPTLRGASHLQLYPPKGARLWAWLALTAVLAPGAWSFLSEEQEELLVELHNHYRGLVSPSASAMLPLVRRRFKHRKHLTFHNSLKFFSLLGRVKRVQR